MLSQAGKSTASLFVAMLNFDRADKDKDGNIDKHEFKKEVKKKINRIC